jgi:hypothetical protein
MADINFNLNKPGEIYFIHEKDVMTGVRSPYTKIGLVGDKPASDDPEDFQDRNEEFSDGGANSFQSLRTSRDRIKEHQTGNSGILLFDDNVPVVRSGAISATEKAIHDRFANLRIRGEWFMLNDKELEAAIDLARALADEVEQNSNYYALATTFSEQESTAEVIKPDSELVDFTEQLRKTMQRLSEKNNRAALIEQVIAKSMTSAIELEGVAAWTYKKPSRTFNRDLAKALDPEFFERSLVSKVSGTFRVSKQLKAKKEALEKEKAVFLATDKSIQKTAPRDKEVEALHQEYLTLAGEINVLTWEASFGKAFIKSQMGTAREIEGIATWSREMSEPTFKSDIFKKLLIASGRKDEIEKCLNPLTGEPSYSFKVLKMRPYPTNF